MTTPLTPTTTYRSQDGVALRRRRDALGVTRAQLAVATGISMSLICNIEAGAVPKRSKAVPVILATLGAWEQEAAT